MLHSLMCGEVPWGKRSHFDIKNGALGGEIMRNVGIMP